MLYADKTTSGTYIPNQKVDDDDVIVIKTMSLCALDPTAGIHTTVELMDPDGARLYTKY